MQTNFNIKCKIPKQLIQKNINQFVELVYDCIYQSLSPPCIRKGFIKSFIIPDTTNNLQQSISSFLSTLPQSFEEENKKASRSYFQISGNLLTSENFLISWKEYEKNKLEKKSLTFERKKRKREKIENEEDDENNSSDITQEKINEWIDDSTIIKEETEKDNEEEEKNDELLQMISLFDNDGLRKRLIKPSILKKEFESWDFFFCEFDKNNSRKLKKKKKIDEDWKENIVKKNKKI
jgi:hypothetical protein